MYSKNRTIYNQNMEMGISTGFHRGNSVKARGQLQTNFATKTTSGDPQEVGEDTLETVEDENAGKAYAGARAQKPGRKQYCSS